MTNENKPKKPRGRPPADIKASARLPVVQVTPEKLEIYKSACNRSGKTFSAWVRDALDKTAKES